MRDHSRAGREHLALRDELLDSDRPGHVAELGRIDVAADGEKRPHTSARKPVDERRNADKGAWEAQKVAQRRQVTSAARQSRVRDYLAGLRETAKLEDNRKAILAAQRQQSTT